MLGELGRTRDSPWKSKQQDEVSGELSKGRFAVGTDAGNVHSMLLSTGSEQPSNGGEWARIMGGVRSTFKG